MSLFASILYFYFTLYYIPVESVPVQASSLLSPVFYSGQGTSILQHLPPINSSIYSLVNAHANVSDLILTIRPLPNFRFFTLDWPITATISLKLNVGSWKLPPDRILECLTAANDTVGKKVGTQILERKFKQEQGSRVNTLLFEIGPGYTDTKRLTWGDVALVLGIDGLPKFFVKERYWTSTYFDVMHARWGKVGEGAVRKWYQ